MAEQLVSSNDGPAMPPDGRREDLPQPVPAPPVIRATVLDIPGSGTRIIYISR